MIRILIVLLMLMPGWVVAQQLPALYDVSGVQQNDTLNVRSGPSTSFDVIAKLAPNDTGIEVVDTNADGDWGLIILDEGSGWVALRYLARQANQPDDGLPRYLNCAGTEPFWGFFMGLDRKAKFTRLDETVPFENVHAVQSSNRTDRHALFADGGEVVITAMVGRDQCSDGMSDRIYGLGIDLLVTDQAEVTVFSGCCSVAR